MSEAVTAEVRSTWAPTLELSPGDMAMAALYLHNIHHRGPAHHRPGVGLQVPAAGRGHGPGGGVAAAAGAGLRLRLQLELPA